MHRQQSEAEELKDFRRLHRANCLIYFLHFALLGSLFFLFIMWVTQDSTEDPNILLQEATFDPETQTFV